jgi:hypothetical protein
VICGVDNGHRNLTELKADFNKDDITRKVTAKYIKWEYQNRQRLQQRSHKSGGVQFLTDTTQIDSFAQGLELMASDTCDTL